MAVLIPPHTLVFPQSSSLAAAQYSPQDIRLMGWADTTGAVAGGLAGLKYGDDIPEDWLSVIARREEIEGLCGTFSQSFEEGRTC